MGHDSVGVDIIEKTDSTTPDRTVKKGEDRLADLLKSQQADVAAEDEALTDFGQDKSAPPARGTFGDDFDS